MTLTPPPPAPRDPLHALWRTPGVPLWDTGIALGERRRQYLYGLLAFLPAAVVFVFLAGVAGLLLADLAEALAGPRAGGITLAVCGLAALGVLIIPLRFVVRGLHGRPFRSVVSRGAAWDWGLCARSAALWAGLLGVPILLMALAGEVPLGADWRLALAVGLAALPVVLAQVTFEETLFRGYLAQGVQRAVRSPVATMVLTSLAFVALHGEAYADGAWTFRASVLSIGLFLAAVTWRADRLEPAIGIHLAQNMVALFVLGVLEPEVPSVTGVAALAEDENSPAEVAAAVATLLTLYGLYWLLAFRLGWVLDQRRG